MSNFMGPMAPPPAAPGQPPQVEFQTDPNQRQRFKQFMKQRMQPPMPQMPAPMPQPMPTVPAGSYILPDMDIFAPQQFYDGGIVGGLNNLGKMSGQMVEALNQVVYGGDPMGGGMPSAPSGPPSMGGGNMPPPLPPIDSSASGGVPTAQPYDHIASTPMPPPATTIGNGHVGDGLFGGGSSPNVSDGRYIPDANGSYLEVYPLGGGPMSGGTPTQLGYGNPPRGMEGQPGYGNIAQPALGGNVGGDFMSSAQNYFGNNIDPRGPVTPMTPENILRQAQMRNMQQDMKPPEVQAYLDNIIKTGGRPTMMAPKIDYSKLMGVLPGGGMIAGKPGAGFGMPAEGGLIDPFRNPYSVMVQPTIGGNVAEDKLMGVLPNGGVTSGQMPPGFTPLPPGELGFTENMMDIMGPIEAYAGGSKYFDESTGLYTGPDRNQDSLYKFADGGSVSDALADALSNDIGDYAADDTMTDLAQTSYNDFDPGGNESYDAAAMDQFRNQQRSDISDIIGQQIQSSITANQQMGTPAPVPQSRIEQMQFENLQNVPTTEPVFSMPSLNMGGKYTSFDLLGNPLTIGFEDGGSVPPRETDIRGMHHELSYITPDEADILMALGGSGEPGPMGIPSYRPGGDDIGSENAGSGDHSGGSGSASGANSGNDDSGNDDSDNASDDDMGDVGIMDGPGYSGPDFSGEEGDDFSSGNYGNDDGSFDASDFADFGVQDAKENAIKSAFVTDTSGKPIGTRSGYVTQGRATDAELAAGYKALGLPDPNSDLASADVEASYGVPANAIESVSSGVPSAASKSGLLGFNYDLLQSNIDKAIEARKGMPTQVSPLATSPFNARNQAAAAAAPSSNVVDNFSPTPADQLADVYGIDLDALNAAVDDPTAAMGARGPTATDAKAGIGYDPVTDMPFGLEFATNPQTGAQITTNLAGLTEQQKANQPFSMDIAQFIGSNPYGYELDPATGNPIGQVGTAPFGILGGLTTLAQDLIMGKPQTVQDLIERGAYTGMTGQDGGDDIFGGGGGDDPIIIPPEPEEVAPESTDPNQIGGINNPADPLAPAGPVLVPSTRTSTPFSGQMPVGYGTPQTGQINPYALAEMQRYEQMLARLNQPRSPIGLADGGSVLDAAAGRFLESLTAA